MNYLICLLFLSLLGNGLAQEKSDSIQIDLGIIVNGEGKVIASNGRKVIHRYFELYFVENGSGKFIVLNPEGNKIMKLRNVIHIDDRSLGVYRVLFESGTTGILHPTTGEWIIPPKNYADILPLLEKPSPYSINLKPSGYFSVNDSKDVSSWYVIDAKENVLFDSPIDYPLVELTDFTIIRNNDKYGLVNSALDLIKRIEYDWIHFSGGFYFLLKDGKWRFFSKEYGISKNAFDQISIKQFQKGFIVFQGDQVGYVDFHGEFLIPLVSKETFVQKHSLKDLSPEVKDASKVWFRNNYGRFGALYSDTANRIFGRITMENVLRSMVEMTTENERMYFESGKMGMTHTRGPKARSWLPFPAIDRGNIRTEYRVANAFFSKNYYSRYERISRYDSSLIIPEVTYSNYRIHGDSLIPVALTDLFKPVPKLKKILAKIIDLDMNEIGEDEVRFYDEGYLMEDGINSNFEKVMRSFSISSEGIWFHGPGIISDSLLIGYDTLLKHLELVSPIE